MIARGLVFRWVTIMERREAEAEAVNESGVLLA